MSAPAIRVRNLGKRYVRAKSTDSVWRRLVKRDHPENRHFWALDNLSLDIDKGEAVGIIGHNGAGKSTFLKVISRIIAPTTGEARLYGKVNSLLEVGTGFQPDLSGRKNIFLNASILGMTRDEVESIYDDIVEFSGLRDFIDMPVKHYSSGMYSRLAFSIGAHVTGDILAVDEVLSVGDNEFRRKCLARMDDLLGNGKRTILFVSHSMDAISRLCSRAIWLDHGKLRADGPCHDVIKEYLGAVNPLRALAKFHRPTTPDQSEALPTSEDNKPDAAPRQTDSEISKLDAAKPKIVAASILDQDGNEADVVFRDQSIGIAFEVEVSHPETISGFIAVRCAPRKGLLDTVQVFSAISPGVAAKPGRQSFSVNIPANLFNSALYHVSVGVVAAGQPSGWHDLIKQALSFQVVERDSDHEVIADYTRGVIRPNLSWSP